MTLEKSSAQGPQRTPPASSEATLFSVFESVAGDMNRGRTFNSRVFGRRLRPEPLPKDSGRERARPSLIINAASNWIGLAVNVIIGFLLTPFVISHLGKNGYGILSLVGSIVGYYGVLDLGVATAVTRYVARQAALRDYDAINGTVSTAMTFFAVVGAVMIGVSIAAGAPLATFFAVRADQRMVFCWTLIALATGTALNLVGQVFRATIAAHEYFLARNATVITTALARAGLTVCALLAGWGLFGVAVSYVIAELLAFLTNSALCFKLISRLHIRLGRVHREILGRMLRYGIAAFVASVASTFRFGMDSLVLGSIVDIEAVAIFAVPAALIQYFINGICTGSSVLGPRFTALHAQQNYSEVKTLLARSIWISASLAFVGATVLLIFGRALIMLWVGPEFSASAKLLWILVMGVSLPLAQDPAFNLLYALNKHQFLAATLLLEGLANLLLSVWLGLTLGAIGVALGTAIPMVINNLVLQPLYICHTLGLPYRAYYVRLAPWGGIVVLTAFQVIRS